MKRITNLFSIKVTHSTYDAGNVSVLAESVGVGTGAALTLLLDVDLDDGAKTFEVLAQIRWRHIFLQVADEQRPCCLRMVFVKIGFQRPEFVVVYIKSRVPRRHFDLAAEKEFVAWNFQCLVHVFRFLEPKYS